MSRYALSGKSKIIGIAREVQGLRKDGSVFPLNLGVSEVYSTGHRRFLGTVRDLTEIKYQERILNNTLNELERSNEALQDFAYIASHDLREPIRKIQLFIDRLETCPVDDSTKKANYFKRIQNAVSRMNKLLDDLLEFSHLTTQSKPFEKVDLNDTAKEVIDILQGEIYQSKAVIKIEGLPEIEAESYQMKQLFQNLIQNSLKFSQKNVPPNISLKTESQGNHWVIQFEDNGIGFDTKYSKRIFKPFERLHGKSSYSGSGIGLAICKKIVDHHQGSIKVESAIDIGSRFMVLLPKNRFAQHPDLPQEQ